MPGSMSLTDLIQTVKQMVGGRDCKTNTGQLPYFLCRFGFRPDSQVAERLSEEHLTTVIGVSDNRSEVRTMYLSEPVLAAASSYYTSESEKNRDAVISEVKAQLNSKMLLPPCGDTGEMMSAALLGFTMDKIRMKEGRREEPYMA